jgi:hypothetical protein
VTHTGEVCNGLDDDCDGVIDNGAGTLWFIDLDGDGFGSAATDAQTKTACAKPAGFVESRTDCNDALAQVNPSAAELCDPGSVDENCDGTVNEGCGCSVVGQSQPCCSGRGVQTCEQRDGATALSTCSVSPAAEVCNGVDDDCDGLLDETGPGLCPASAQRCTAGSCACPGGQALCNGACVTLSAEVCDGVDNDCDGQIDEPQSADGGATGLCPLPGQVCAAASCGCPAGQSLCNGTCTTPGVEVCDGLDNDCNGQVDEGLTIACAADPDGDGYASGAETTQQCPDASRPQAGNCPLGFVAPAQSAGVDCQPANGALYRLVSARADGDEDGACSGAAANDCVGVSALPGRRFASACSAVDDCNDANGALYRLVASRSDADNDTTCVGPSSFDCVGAAPLAGRRFTASCAAADDCNDLNAGLYRLMASRADADADGYCAGAVAQDCVGATALPGRRFSANCDATDDCDDANSGLFRLASVRTDADNDGWCAGNASTQCIGSSPPAGQRLAANCQGDDCRDTNSQATSACTLPAAYATTSHVQTCPNGAQTFTLGVLNACPLGFTTAGTYTAQRLAGLGFCVANSEVSITQTCNFLEGTTCRVIADCVALPVY